jgi:endonuclease YncB( thermonuclease family)
MNWQTIASMQGKSILETRREQVFPILEAAEIERVRRFGTVRRYADGDPLAKVGVVGPGLTIILTGVVEVSRHDPSGTSPRSSRTAGAHSWANLRNWRDGLHW